jgi:hypothetical protein
MLSPNLKSVFSDQILFSQKLMFKTVISVIIDNKEFLNLPFILTNCQNELLHNFEQKV